MKRVEKKIHYFRTELDEEIKELQSDAIVEKEHKFIELLHSLRERFDIAEDFFLKELSALIDETNNDEIHWSIVEKKAQRAKYYLSSLYAILIELESLRKNVSRRGSPNYSSHEEMRDLVEQRYSLLESPTSGGFSYKMYFKGGALYDELVADILSAKEYIYLEYFTLSPDRVGNDIAHALIQKASEWKLYLNGTGKSIILLLDDFGSPDPPQLKKKLIQLVEEMRHVGIIVYFFNPPKYSRFINPIVSNGRDHRKIVVIDGKVGYFGGMNIEIRHLLWRDTHLRVQGAIVDTLEKEFKEMIQRTSDYEKIIAKISFEKKKNVARYKQLFDKVKIKQTGQEGKDWHILTNVPTFFRHDIRQEYLNLILASRKEICITNPYFAPGRRFVNALVKAARRGVHVRIVIPEKTDSNLINIISSVFFEELLGNGVRIFLYGHQTKEGMVHAKTMVVDGIYSTIGSSNLDYLSLTSNYEINGFFSHRKIADELMVQFEKDLANSKEVTFSLFQQEQKKRGLFNRTIERMTYWSMRLLFKPIDKLYD